MVVVTVKGGRQKWVLFGTGDTPYKVPAHLWYATEAIATARWQKAIRGGGGSKPPPHSGRRGGQPDPNSKPTEAAAEPAIGSAPAQPATGSAQDRARDTQALWESPSSREL